MSDFATLAAKLKEAGIVNDKAAEVDTFLDTGFLPLNDALSSRWDGGWPVKRVVEIFGPASCGKTALATNAMIAAQRMGGIGVFHDHERSFSDKQGKNLGLDLTPGKWIYQMPPTYEHSCETFQQVLETVRKSKIIPASAPICYVFDSLAQMIPLQQYKKGFTKLNMNDTSALSRVTSVTMKSIASMAEEYNVCVIFLNQTRSKIGVIFGDPTTTPGGDSVKFSSSVRVQVGASRISVGEGESKEIVGQQVTARCVKNKITRPFQKAEWRFMFAPDGSGHFDALGSLTDYCVRRDLIKSVSKGKFGWEGEALNRAQLISALVSAGGVPFLNKMIIDSDLHAEVDEDAAKEAAEAEALALKAAAELT